MATDVPGAWPEFHPDFGALLDTLVDARNDVMHVGARARHLTSHAVQVCLVLEDALQQGLNSVADFMVSGIVSVARWQPLSMLRHEMLEHSFTFIPVAPDRPSGGWVLVADHHLARFMGERAGRRERLAKPVGVALSEGLESMDADVIEATETVGAARMRLRDHPLLVRSGDHVVGIVSAFDLL